MMPKELPTKSLEVERGNSPKLNSVEVACHRLGIGKTMLYRAMHDDPKYRRGLPHLKSLTIGGKRLVSDAAIEEFIADLERHQAAQAA